MNKTLGILLFIPILASAQTNPSKDDLPALPSSAIIPASDAPYGDKTAGTDETDASAAGQAPLNSAVDSAVKDSEAGAAAAKKEATIAAEKRQLEDVAVQKAYDKLVKKAVDDFADQYAASTEDDSIDGVSAANEAAYFKKMEDVKVVSLNPDTGYYVLSGYRLASKTLVSTTTADAGDSYAEYTETWRMTFQKVERTGFIDAKLGKTKDLDVGEPVETAKNFKLSKRSYGGHGSL